MEANPLLASDRFETCGVFAGVGARSRIGELTKPWRWRKGRLSRDSFESSASSSTFCKSVLTWHLSKASPDPGVLFLNLMVLCLVMADDGVSKPPVATPTIGESFVISISADRSCCCFVIFCLDFETLFSESSIFPEEHKQIKKI